MAFHDTWVRMRDCRLIPPYLYSSMVTIHLQPILSLTLAVVEHPVNLPQGILEDADDWS